MARNIVAPIAGIAVLGGLVTVVYELWSKYRTAQVATPTALQATTAYNNSLANVLPYNRAPVLTGGPGAVALSSPSGLNTSNLAQSLLSFFGNGAPKSAPPYNVPNSPMPSFTTNVQNVATTGLQAATNDLYTPSNNPPGTVYGPPSPLQPETTASVITDNQIGNDVGGYSGLNIGDQGDVTDFFSQG